MASWSELPVTERMRPRPLLRRIMRRYDCEEWGVPLPDPDDDEIRDAIRVLEQGPMPGPLPDPVWVEAHRILDECGQ